MIGVARDVLTALIVPEQTGSIYKPCSSLSMILKHLSFHSPTSKHAWNPSRLQHSSIAVGHPGICYGLNSSTCGFELPSFDL